MTTTQTPLISIILPTHNRAHLLPRALKGIFAQTYENWELVIADDGSTDNTEEVVKQESKNDSRITYFKLPTNQGVSSARNAAFAKTKGKYIAFLDSDDEWLPEKLEKQVARFETSDAHVGLVYTGIIFVDEKAGVQREKQASEEGDIFMEELAYNPVGSPSRVMVRREALEKVGGFDPLFLALEDWDVWLRISKHYAIAAVAEPLIRYHESSDSLSVNDQKLINGYKNLWKKHNQDSWPRWIKALHYLRLGHRLCYYDFMSKGRHYLWQAVKTEPWRLKNIFFFVLSLFGVRVYQGVTFFIMKRIG